MFANVLQPLIDFFEVILVFFHENVGLGWGASIIAMTIVIRSALLPLTMKQMRSMQNIAKHQPEMKRLQERYKHDRERLNQEMMKFYRENQINPLSSCLPLLAQFPVFIALFYLLREDLRYEICPEKQPRMGDSVACGQTDASEFFFISDLTGQATGGVLVLLIVLYVGSQVLSTFLSSMTADKTQRMIFLALPFVFIPFIWTFPAGLLVYWITTNLWTIVQGVIVRRNVGHIRPGGDDEDVPKATGLAGLLGLPSKEARELAKKRQAEAGSLRERLTGMTDPGAATAKAAPKGKTGVSVEKKAGTRTAKPPPSPPRKKKKRSGRRR